MSLSLPELIVRYNLLTSSILDSNATSYRTFEYKEFFQLHGIESHIIRDAFESSLINRINKDTQKYEVTFIGSLCTNYQFNKTCLLESVAEFFDFHWWGPIGEEKDSYPFLMKSHNGITGGLEMYNIYANTKVNINDYPDVAGGTLLINVFLRLWGVAVFY